VGVDGTNWTQITAGAAADSGDRVHVFTDPITQSVLSTALQGHFYNLDMYRWMAGGWVQLNPATDSVRALECSRRLDPPHNQVVLFGETGQRQPEQHVDVGGTTWTEVFPNTQPPLVYDPRARFDPAIGHPILFGGGNGGQRHPGHLGVDGHGLDATLPAEHALAARAFVWRTTRARSRRAVRRKRLTARRCSTDTWWLTVPVSCLCAVLPRRRFRNGLPVPAIRAPAEFPQAASARWGWEASS